MKNNLRSSVLTAVFAALICVLTCYPSIPIPATTEGYLHFGDSVIYLAACFLPTPLAIIAGSLGGGLADFILAPQFIIYTVIIKAFISLPFSNKSSNILTKRNLLILPISGIITVSGYFFAEWIMAGSFAAAIGVLLPNFIQATGSSALFILVGTALDKAGFKKRLGGSF